MVLECISSDFVRNKTFPVNKNWHLRTIFLKESKIKTKINKLGQI